MSCVVQFLAISSFLLTYSGKSEGLNQSNQGRKTQSPSYHMPSSQMVDPLVAQQSLLFHLY